LFEWFVVGVPSFALAFLPNDKPIQGKFIYNLIKNALPGALTLVINIAAVYLFNLFVNGSITDNIEYVSTMSTIILTFTGLAMLYKLCKPLTPYTATLFVLMFALCFICMFACPEFFGIISIASLGITNILFVIVLALLAPTLINVLYRIMDKLKI
jgi:cation-transporting ATPase E